MKKVETSKGWMLSLTRATGEGSQTVSAQQRTALPSPRPWQRAEERSWIIRGADDSRLVDDGKEWLMMVNIG